ncbi:DUF551 domain-containing protein [Massilia sp.]|uniref:DUF551 domain-containing protein n=1 Tax=Massilia sp. TaxID=1882437 RepID=UPI00289F0F82|nr:DUF551 domain-containing protein [Massilia sp.]
MNNEQTTKPSSTLTDERIEAMYFDAVVQAENAEDTDHKSIISRFARVIEREVAAQAGHVAVPGDDQWIFDLAANYEVGGKGLYGPCTFSAEGLSKFAHAVLRSSAVAQQAPEQAEPGWISADERLPDGGYCLATYRDRAGKLRIIRAKYVRQYEVEASGDECGGQSTEYNEAYDTEYLKAGWLECIDNWGEYSSVYVCEGEVTHWRRLPPLPGAQASTPDVRESAS